MASSIPPGRLRRTFGREKWAAPEPFGPDGWFMNRKDRGGRVIVSVGRFEGVAWVHASISHPDSLPTYDELVTLHRAVWGEEGWAFQVFAPPSDHISIHDYALHLWGRLDGEITHPNFGANGSI